MHGSVIILLRPLSIVLVISGILGYFCYGSCYIIIVLNTFPVHPGWLVGWLGWTLMIVFAATMMRTTCFDYRCPRMMDGLPTLE